MLQKDNETHKRIVVNRTVAVRDRKGKVFRLRMSTLAARGAELVHHDDFPVGTDLTLRFVVPERNGSVHPIQIKGRVVSSRIRGDRFCISVQFLGLKEEDRAVIDAHIDALELLRSA